MRKIASAIVKTVIPIPEYPFAISLWFKVRGIESSSWSHFTPPTNLQDWASPKTLQTKF